MNKNDLVRYIDFKCTMSRCVSIKDGSYNRYRYAKPNCFIKVSSNFILARLNIIDEFFIVLCMLSLYTQNYLEGISWTNKAIGLTIKKTSIKDFLGQRLVTRQNGSGSDNYLKYICKRENINFSDFIDTSYCS